MRHRIFTAGVSLVAVGALGMAAGGIHVGQQWTADITHMTGEPASGYHGQMMGWSDGADRSWRGHMMGWSGAVTENATIPGAPSVVVALSDFAFSPDLLEISSSVNIEVENLGRSTHDLSIPDLGFSIRVAPGQSARAGLDLPPPGEYRILCSVPGHAEAGMVGTIRVKG